MQMSWMPEPVERLLEIALVGELTVVDGHGRPVTYPLIPLYDGDVGLYDVVDALQPEARAHQRQPEGVAVDHRSGGRRRSERPGHDPGRCPRDQ